jgi:hypothetical protein
MVCPKPEKHRRRRLAATSTNMNKRRIEALTEAVSRYSGYFSPESDLYVCRNPLGLKAFSPLQLRNEDGFRVFASLIDGYQAGIYDVTLKVSGQSKAHLKPTDTLSDFAVALGQPYTAADAFAGFLRKALHTETINRKTPLSIFLEEQ